MWERIANGWEMAKQSCRVLALASSAARANVLAALCEYGAGGRASPDFDVGLSRHAFVQR